MAPKLKDLGNEAFSRGDYAQAVKIYTQAINELKAASSCGSTSLVDEAALSIHHIQVGLFCLAMMRPWVLTRHMTEDHFRRCSCM